jgi:hypothetical protein
MTLTDTEIQDCLDRIAQCKGQLEAERVLFQATSDKYTKLRSNLETEIEELRALILEDMIESQVKKRKVGRKECFVIEKQSYEYDEKAIVEDAIRQGVTDLLSYKPDKKLVVDFITSGGELAGVSQVQKQFLMIHDNTETSTGATQAEPNGRRKLWD